MTDFSESTNSFSEVQSAKGLEVLALLTEIDPISEEPKHYPLRTEKFCKRLTLQRLTTGLTPEYLNHLVDRMFSAEEVSEGGVAPAKLAWLKLRICNLFVAPSE